MLDRYPEEIRKALEVHGVDNVIYLDGAVIARAVHEWMSGGKDVSEIKWKSEPAEHDYPAAASYLALLMPETLVTKLAKELREAEVVEFHAKDIIRASGLSVLNKDNHHVKKDLEKISQGEKLSPILLVRDYEKVTIADGYHRLCAVYLTDEDARVPCKIVTG